MVRKYSQTTRTDVAIIGAGPYGLSISAHLSGLEVDHRIFGRPMAAWADLMPAGMALKSEGFASNLSDPCDLSTLAAYRRAAGLPYADLGLPVALDDFVAYGRDFACRHVPHLEEVDVADVREAEDGFQLRLVPEGYAVARAVICATGVAPFARILPELSDLPGHLLSHSSGHRDLGRFAGRRVAVVGAGASGLDVSAALVEAGAEVTLVARRPVLAWNARTTDQRSFVERLRAPMSGIGQGWRSRASTDLPLVFHALPEGLRHTIVSRHLGPAPGWAVRDRVEGRIATRLGARIIAAEPDHDGVALLLALGDTSYATVKADHVVAATGYWPDVDRLTYLDASLRARVHKEQGGAPALSRRFESSVPGLFFVGASSAPAFGPLMRFVFGARWTATRLSRDLAGAMRLRATPMVPVAT